MTNKTVNAVVAIDPSQLKDDVQEKLTGAGFTAKEVNALLHQLEYRKTYNARPDVQAKRRAYNQHRNAKMRAMRSLLSQL